MKAWLRRAYRRIGIHTAPPGTLFYQLHSFLDRLVRFRTYRYATTGWTQRGRFGGTHLYNIDSIRRMKQVDGLALIFFMGAGDYLMATPLIKALRLAYPSLQLYAYASSHLDAVNSPLVMQFLQTNPLIDAVIPYRGKPRLGWQDYNFSDALSSIPKNFLILPIVWDTNPIVWHRVTAVLETFNLPVDFPISAPITYSTPLSAGAVDILDAIRQKSDTASVKGIVCCHFGARSSGYEYPHAAVLTKQLARQGYLVVSFSPVAEKHDNLIEIDVTRITPNDTVELLRALKQQTANVSVIAINSIMWPISAALDIPILGLHMFFDESIHQYVYPNMFIVTQYSYTTLSPSRTFIAPGFAFTQRRREDGVAFTDYQASFVADCFETMRDMLG